ncbi:hypothetical protein PC39_00265 [Salinisphaera sp. PC39]|uniref:DUF748 domain-containing protein n=1 Tax=Salinisphaera sp. PC39 TaxID=1304156 RepID=UPI00333E39B1
MPRLPAIRRRYRIAAAVAAAILLFLWLLPIGLRLGAEHWLESRGYTAAIDNVDLNLFTGRLAIDGARAEDTAGDGFHIGHAAVDLHYLPLFDRQLHLAGLTLHDAALDLRRDDGLRVAGFDPAAGETPPEDTPAPAEPWGFGLDSADVDGLTLRYHEPGFSREITLATSTASDVATWTPGNPFPLDANLRLGDARVAVEGRLRPFGDRVAGELSLRVEKLTLQAFAPFVEGRGGVERLAGTFGADLDIAVDYAGDTGLDLDVTGQAGLADGEIELVEIATIAAGIDWQGEIEARLLRPDGGDRVDTDGRLSLSNASAGLATAPYDIAARELAWEGRAGLLPGADAVPADAEPPVRVAGTLGGRDLRVDDRNLGRRLLRAADLTVEGIDLAGPADLAIARVAAADVQALARAADAPSRDDYPRTLDLAGLEATGLALTGGDRLTIERLALDTPRGIVVRDPQGGIELTEWFPPGGDETADDEEGGLRVAVAEIAIGGDGQLRFEDRGVEPSAVLDFNKPELTLRDLDTGAPAQASPLTFATGVGRYGRIEIDGDIRPLADPLSLDLTGRVRALNLTPASGYIRQALERRIEQGILDAELDLAVDAGAIDGLAELNLRKFRLGGVVGDSGTVERSLGLPLDRALSLLRDEDGSIGIDLPLGGDLENPQFSLNSVVRQAVLEGVQVAILSYYSPLGVIKVADTLVDLATALRFEPVPFEPGSAELGGDARAYLDRMAGLLEERPQARFVVCGRAVPADREALAPDDEEDKTAAAEDLRERLLALAGQRTYAVTGYLVDAGIDGQRLVPCNPSVDDTEGAAPRATISL